MSSSGSSPKLAARVTMWSPRTRAQSHFKGELWGLATVPRDQLAASGGDDGTLRVWDLHARRMSAIRVIEANVKVKAVAVSPARHHVAAGLDTARVRAPHRRACVPAR